MSAKRRGAPGRKPDRMGLSGGCRMIICHCISFCAGLRSFKLGKLGNFFPTTCAASLTIPQACPPASWEGLSQLPLLPQAAIRTVTQLQVGNGALVSVVPNLNFSSHHNRLGIKSSCEGEAH